MLDQSYSMKGDSIKIAWNALKLQSLRKGSYYQIIGFSSTYTKYNLEPVAYIKDNIEISFSKINDLYSNLGGTDLYSPLKEIYNSNIKKEYKDLLKNIFLLTDGEIENKNETL